MRSLYKFMHKTKKQKGRGPKQEPETKEEPKTKEEMLEKLKTILLDRDITGRIAQHFIEIMTKNVSNMSMSEFIDNLNDFKINILDELDKLDTRDKKIII